MARNNNKFIVEIECSASSSSFTFCSSCASRSPRPNSIERSILNPCKHYVYFKDEDNVLLINIFGVNKIEYLTGIQICYLYQKNNLPVPEHFQVYIGELKDNQKNNLLDGSGNLIGKFYNQQL